MSISKNGVRISSLEPVAYAEGTFETFATNNSNKENIIKALRDYPFG